MEELVRTIAICLLTAFLALLLKERAPLFRYALLLAAAAMLMVELFQWLQQAARMIDTFSAYLPGLDLYLITMVKVLMISFIVEMSAHLLRGADQPLLATIVEWQGKLLIVLIALPIFYELIRLLLSLVPAAL